MHCWNALRSTSPGIRPRSSRTTDSPFLNCRNKRTISGTVSKRVSIRDCPLVGIWAQTGAGEAGANRIDHRRERLDDCGHRCVPARRRGGTIALCTPTLILKEKPHGSSSFRSLFVFVDRLQHCVSSTESNGDSNPDCHRTKQSRSGNA